MKILIAEDDKTSRFLLRTQISEWGYEIVECEDGIQAWNVLKGQDAPRIAVLDWMMPGLTGVDLCKRLVRAKKDGGFVYTIILTARTEDEDVAEAMESGVHDMLAKPLDANILHKRIQVGERMVHYERRLAEQNEKLAEYSKKMEELANARAKALVHADRMSTLGVMSAGIAHEINNPNAFISGNLQTLQTFWPLIEESLAASLAQANGNAKKLDLIREETPKLLEGALKGVTRITGIVNSLKTYAHQDSTEHRACQLVEVIEESLELAHSKLKHRVTVSRGYPDELPLINGVGN